MAAAMKLLRGLRNHWKKSTFAAVLIGFGINVGVEKYEINQLMRAYCEQAKEYGEAPLPVSQKSRHVTVILNPAAKDGKGKKLYEKYAEPLLHLAGIRISLIKTEHEGQAKSLLEIMDNTNAVAVAGGDGTLLEAVTGMLRRPDADIISKNFPIGILPIGQTNTVAKMLFWKYQDSEVRLLAEATMALIKEVCKPLDVMHIEGDSGKPIYALGKVDWGAFRDTQARVSKYWYVGPLKAKMAYLMAALDKWPFNNDVSFSYTLPCSGCSQCYNSEPSNTVSKPSGHRWWHVFVKKPPQNKEASVDYTKIVNKSCGEWHTDSQTVSGISIITSNMFPNCQKDGCSSLEIQLVPNDITRTSFISKGLEYCKIGTLSEASTVNLKVKDIQLKPKVNEDQESWFSIDSEPYEVRPINIKLMKKKVYLYCKDATLVE